MAALLFCDAIAYARVKVFKRRYLPFGLQPKNCAMSPNGAIYFHKSCCLLDSSSGSVQALRWFMHEMHGKLWTSAASIKTSCLFCK